MGFKLKDINNNYYEYSNDKIKTIDIKTQGDEDYNLTDSLSDNNKFVLTGGTFERKPFEKDTMIKLFTLNTNISVIEPIEITTLKLPYFSSANTDEQISVGKIGFVIYG